MFGLLNRPTTVTPVPEVHVDYVDSLQKELDDQKAALDARDEYLRTASAAGVRIAALDRVSRDSDAERKAVISGRKALERIRKLLAAGAEPTTPPDWHCGMLTTPKMVKDRFDRRVWPDETWPHKRRDRYEWSGGVSTVAVFSGAIPGEAIARYAAVKDLLDGVRVYSPNREDFEALQNPVPRDPVLIGRIDVLGKPRYFEIARWDIDADLAKVFTSTTVR